MRGRGPAARSPPCSCASSWLSWRGPCSICECTAEGEEVESAGFPEAPDSSLEFRLQVGKTGQNYFITINSADPFCGYDGLPTQRYSPSLKNSRVGKPI